MGGGKAFFLCNEIPIYSCLDDEEYHADDDPWYIRE